MVTPLTDRDTLDVAGLERLVERLVSGGVAGIFALGTTGEAPSLGYRLRRELIEHTCRFVRGRIPVLVGITDTSLVESVTLAHHAADCGAEAVVTSAPFYFPAGQPELREYLEQLLPELPLPLMLYNMPALTKTSFSGEVVSWALDQEAIVGLKDSSGDLVYFRRMRRLAAKARPDWSFLVGGANLHPSLYVSLYGAAKAGDLAMARELSSRVMDLSEAIYRVGKHGSAIIKGLKCSLSILGVCDDFMAAPFHRFHEAERAVIRERLTELGIAG
jgi:4-hydroxy-tetrahydrodipicolinate synthase